MELRSIVMMLARIGRITSSEMGGAGYMEALSCMTRLMSKCFRAVDPFNTARL
jgi:hypothetical protein